MNMNIGMLWFDNDEARDFDKRVVRAADFYREKYGKDPNVCFVHPSTDEGKIPGRVDGLAIRTSGSILEDHFWLGTESRN